MNTNLPSYTNFLPPMPFNAYQNFMQKCSEIERLRQTWKELWKLIQGYDLMKDAIYELDNDVRTLSSEVTTLIENLSDQIDSAVNEYGSSQTFKTLIDDIASNITYEYSKVKTDKVPDATEDVSVFDDNQDLQDSGVDVDPPMNSGSSEEIEPTEKSRRFTDYDD